ncbi:Kef family K(+) transporter [Aquabacterium sp. A7-Y]|uniref:YbaL family putative K(+) efflux transporter n=1 Tax=Aquabacterium sp. A7-Y TaxID=1349605 RepID=UPI00223CE7E1|nr:YbaL family putative K(+) efflux transporter [Aquabacterium sp. A7-Y]MCW7538765.1 Kef family K(+) transporter [Aquabacterium sp. A7-Y]
MPHSTPLLATLVGGLCLAFLLGTVAQRLRLPPLVGYLLAGVAAGPFTPGFVADQDIANELAELGVILLMFGVGLHFSLRDLLSVRRIAIPGALAQIAAATAMGWGIGRWLGWSHVAGLVFGLCLSVASTVVLLRALQERDLVDSDRGHIAIGWLVVEDLVMVLTLVLLPAATPLLLPGGSAAQPSTGSLFITLGLTLGKVSAFVALMLVVGRRFIPWLLDRVAESGSKELFRLAVLAVALGIAFGAASLFGVSFALGAFFAGMVLGESELSHEAAEETVPLRDAFAVLFFVSIGMLLDPRVFVREPLAVLAVFAVIVAGKSLIAFAIVKAFRHPTTTALTISASLAQIGEFSFILGGLAISLKLMPEDARDLILAGAILSILFNPLIFAALAGLARRAERRSGVQDSEAAADNPARSGLSGHTVLVGHGRVGSRIARRLRESGHPLVVIEDRLEVVRELRSQGYEVLCGNGARPALLEQAGIARASRLVVAIPNAFEAAEVVHSARQAHAGLRVVARAHSDSGARHLHEHGADRVILAEAQLAQEMAEWVLVEDVTGRLTPASGAAPRAPAA